MNTGLHRTALLAALLVTLAVAGCGGTKKPQPAGLTAFTPVLPATVAWKADVGRALTVETGVGQFSPAVSGDHVTAASSTGSVTRVQLSDGKLVWRVDVGTPIVAGVAVGSGASVGMAAVITTKNELVVIAADGKVARTIALGGVGLEIPAITGSTVVVRLADNRVSAWDVATGTRRWVIQRTLPPLVLHAQSGLRVAAQSPEDMPSAVIGPTDVLVNMAGGRLVWLNATTGAVRWEAQVATPRGSNEVERIVDLLGAAMVEGPDVCVSSYQTLVSCFGAESGRRLWSRDFNVASPLAADSRFVFVADEQSRLHALSRRDGSTAWSIDTFQLRNLMSPVVSGRALWVGDRFGVLHGLDRDSGKIIARVNLDGGTISGAMRATRSGLVVQTQGGQLMLIRTEG